MINKGPSFINTMKHDSGGDSASGFYLLDTVMKDGLGGSRERYVSEVWENAVFLLVTWRIVKQKEKEKTHNPFKIDLDPIICH